MRYDIDFIRSNSVRILDGYGVKKSERLVDSMLAADMSGIATHGIKMLPAYVNKIEKGFFSNKSIEIVKQTPAFTTVNANNAIGAVSAIDCVTIAIEKAKQSGIHIVFSKNCNTYGPAFYYVEQIAKSGLIGFTCCNSPAAMPFINGVEAMLGTNPFAFACPSKSKGTIIIDMATSVVAKSKFLMAKNKNEKLQEGWALDNNGNPTTDPIEAIKGLVLPMAGAKGCGIAMMIDILSGMLSGAAYLNKVGKFYSETGQPMNVGQVFVAIDPSIIYDGDFLEEMDDYLHIIRNSKHSKLNNISIPGDRKMAERLRSEEGIELLDETVEKLEDLFGMKIISK